MKHDVAVQRPPLVVWTILWLVPLAHGLASLAGDLSRLDGVAVASFGGWIGRDFSNVWVGGRLALLDGNVYDLATYFRALDAAGIKAAQNYSYPPHSLLYAAPLSLLPYPVALGLWVTAGAAMLYFAAKPLVPFNALWVLTVTPTLLCNGQYGAIAGALYLWSFRKDELRSGMAAGLLTIKPHMGVLLAVAIAGKLRYRQMLVALVLAVLLLGLAELRFGLLAEYLTDGVATQTAILTTTHDQPYFRGIGSAYVALRNTPFALAGQIVAAFTALALLWRVRDCQFPSLCFPIATATFLILPYSFDYDMIIATLGFGVLIYNRWYALTLIERAIAAYAFCAPLFAPTGFVPLILLGGLWLQVRSLEQEETLPGIEGGTA